MSAQQKITPCLWFNLNAEAAIEFYLSVFPDGRILQLTRCGQAGPGPAGSLLMASFELAGQELLALNGGPNFPFTEAVSLHVRCATQDEIDYYWEKLTADGGAPSQCGWLKDKFGLSWQIVPTIVPQLLDDSEPEKSARVMQAIMQMVKPEIATLQAAYDGRGSF